MYFTKVTVPSLTAGLYPSLGYVEYNTVGQAIRLTNVKNDVPYSVDGDETDMSHELEAYPAKDVNSFYCQNYRGNVCDQLYLKAGAESAVSSSSSITRRGRSLNCQWTNGTLWLPR